MSQNHSSRTRLPKGVSALPRIRGGRGFRASIRKGKGVEVHLGLYATPWLAAFAFGLAARALGRDAPSVEVPRAEEPSADQVREITDRVRRRLGLDKIRRPTPEVPPAPDELLTLFEVTVVGFWRDQAGADGTGHPGAGVDAAAGRLIDSARLLFWSRSAGHPEPLDAMIRLLARRLDGAFHRAELTREVLDDDGDDEWRVARWLVHPDALSGGRIAGFREEVRSRYADLFDGTPSSAAGWAEVLEVSPPFDPEQVRAAYRARSHSAHPDTGGTDAEFVRLNEAYEEARAYFAARWR